MAFAVACMRGIGYHVVHAFSARCQVRVERARRAPRATAAEAHTTVPQPWPWPPIATVIIGVRLTYNLGFVLLILDLRLPAMIERTHKISYHGNITWYTLCTRTKLIIMENRAFA